MSPHWLHWADCQAVAPPKSRVSELEVISQQVEEDNQAPVQLVSFAYRDLPLAGLDISLAGSQLISNPDEEDNRDGGKKTHINATAEGRIWQPSKIIITVGTLK
ncbi:Transmembrane protein 266 [Dissostichus eleginoides]|uniref:Transmembrane protein 266 n=1 Tax=Dissostichus eleginoides TaxID=100907 RepID=A0AAD9F6F9_DISEL|nr:Transmembrane protein 266 [Dissostichus eleginoides]